VPNSGQKLERLAFRTETWDAAMIAHVRFLEKKKPVVWTGDLNCAVEEIDIHNSKKNQKSAGHTPAERANFRSFTR
jgi:exodeoxyribonuclease-3